MFEDFEKESAIQESLKQKRMTEKPKYLDQDWKLKTDAEEEDIKYVEMNAPGSKTTKNDAELNPTDPNEMPANDELYPCFAVMYKFKSEYVLGSIEKWIAEHEIYNEKFKRVLNSETLVMNGTYGAVVLFVGLNADDHEATVAEIDDYLSGEPFLQHGAVEDQKVLDLLNIHQPAAVEEEEQEEDDEEEEEEGDWTSNTQSSIEMKKRRMERA